VLGYEVIKKLADGAAAEAFLAREKGSQDRVLLEILRPELTSDAKLIEHFLDEAKVRQNLEHPNVTRRVSTGRTSDGRLFVVTEPVDGQSLSATLWSQGSLAVQDVIRLMLPLCDALEYMHRAGVIHGNVKPDNVYLSGGLEAFNPKLLDYGLALFRDEERIGNASNLEHTEPKYQAPECIRGEKPDPRADIYALGILMYEALTGFPPFTAGSPSEILRKQRDELPPALPASCEELASIIYRCLSKDPDDRYPSASALREALAERLERPIAESPITSEPAKRPASMVHLGDLPERFASSPSAMALPMETIPHRGHGSWPSTLLQGRSLYWAGALVLLLGSFPLLKRIGRAESRVAATRPLTRHSQEQRAPRAASKPSDEPPPPKVATAKRLADPTAVLNAGATVPLNLSSTPSGARVVRLDSGEELGTTPLTTRIPKLERQVTIRIELPGYQPVERTVWLDAASSAEVQLEPVASAPVRKIRARHRPLANPDESMHRDDVINPFEQ
jgi:serine/threonine protein kinase